MRVFAFVLLLCAAGCEIRQVLLCGTDDGLYAYNGHRTSVLRLEGATKLRFATLSS